MYNVLNQIGKKIKYIRLNSGMTQKTLAGNYMTRNMLSSIENGTAQPSLETLCYIAARLNVSPDYFLSDTNDELLYKKIKLIGIIKEKLKSREYNSCINLCSSFNENLDDELYLILAHCYCNTAVYEYNCGNITAAKNSFDLSYRYSKKTIYNSSYIQSTCILYDKIIDSYDKKNGEYINHTILNYDLIEKILNNIENSDLFFFLYIKNIILKGDLQSAENLIKSNIIGDELLLSFLEAKKAIYTKNNKKAIEILTSISYRETATLIKIEILSDLIELYEQKSDYENSYNCSFEKQKLISMIK